MKTDLETLKAWCHWVTKNPLNEGQAELANAVNDLISQVGTFRARAKELEAKVEQEDADSWRLAFLEREITRLRAALQIYADLDDWGYDHGANSKCDFGAAAREALMVDSKPSTVNSDDTQPRIEADSSAVADNGEKP